MHVLAKCLQNATMVGGSIFIAGNNIMTDCLLSVRILLLVGIDSSWVERYEAVLGERLQELLDDPFG